MALIKCPECGKEISDQAQACPQCAYPIAAKRDEALLASAAAAEKEEQNRLNKIAEAKAQQDAKGRFILFSIGAGALLLGVIIITWASSDSFGSFITTLFSTLFFIAFMAAVVAVAAKAGLVSQGTIKCPNCGYVGQGKKIGSKKESACCLGIIIWPLLFLIPFVSGSKTVCPKCGFENVIKN